jgi:hypothetical protein
VAAAGHDFFGFFFQVDWLTFTGDLARGIREADRCLDVTTAVSTANTAG